MKITIKNIIRWEQLREKAFGELKVSEPDDVIALMYVTTPEEEIGNTLFEDYRDIAKQSPRIVEKHSVEINKYLDYINQFSHKGGETPEDPMALRADKENEPESSASISNVAMNLLYSGVGAKYLMNEAELCDLSILGKGAEEKMHRRMEEERLWTYLTLQPYIGDGDKIRKASDLYPFPWEEKPVIVSDEDMAMAENILFGNEKVN